MGNITLSSSPSLSSMMPAWTRNEKSHEQQISWAKQLQKNKASYNHTNLNGRQVYEDRIEFNKEKTILTKVIQTGPGKLNGIPGTKLGLWLKLVLRSCQCISKLLK